MEQHGLLEPGGCARCDPHVTAGGTDIALYKNLPGVYGISTRLLKIIASNGHEREATHL